MNGNVYWKEDVDLIGEIIGTGLVFRTGTVNRTGTGIRFSIEGGMVTGT